VSATSCSLSSFSLETMSCIVVSLSMGCAIFSRNNVVFIFQPLYCRS
jgi:hypothetical protein